MVDALILVGGKGTRLSSIISDIPKPMAPIQGRPFLEYQLESLIRQNFTRVILATGYKSEVIQNHFGNKWNGLEIIYSIENIPLGTGGAITTGLLLAQTEKVFVMNGDTFVNIDYVDYINYMDSFPNDIGVAITQVSDSSRFGSIKFDPKTKNINIQNNDSGYINAGVYYLSRNIFFNRGYFQNFSFEQEILCDKKISCNLIGYPISGIFIDIGVPDDYERAQEIVG